MSKTVGFYIGRIFGLILLLATAAVFLFSGVSKLYAFEDFTWNIIDAGISNLTIAGIVARLFIGFELLLGVFLVAHVHLRSFTYPAVIFLLLLFNGYLVLLMLRQGDEGNCGCFGNAVVMKPSEAIIKNMVLLVVTVLLYFIYRVKRYRYTGIVAVTTGLIALAVPFLVLPSVQTDRPDVVEREINLAPLLRAESYPKHNNLGEGKHIVAFLSLTCSHCKKAAFKLQVIHRQHPEIPIFMVLNGAPRQVGPFFEETHAHEVPHMYFKGPEEFVSMAGTSVPAIYWINDGKVERKSNIYQLDPKHMLQWLSE